MMKLSKRMILLGVVQIPVGSELLRGQQIWRTHLHVYVAGPEEDYLLRVEIGIFMGNETEENGRQAFYIRESRLCYLGPSVISAISWASTYNFGVELCIAILRGPSVMVNTWISSRIRSSLRLT
jgi:hypothetical protein